MHKSLRSHLKFLLTILVLSLSLLTNAQTHDGDGTVYVKPSPTGTGDGSSWDNATNNLQGAIDAAGTKKVFVAVGNYPAPSPYSFIMKHGVSIYGGFVPESGIIDLDDERRILPTKSDFVAGTGSVLDGKNERRVISNVINQGSQALTNTDILDGFTITNGKGTVHGGGIYSGNGSPVLSNLLITENFATRGGGIFCDKGNLNVINSIIVNNVANSSTADNGSGVFIYSDNGFPINPVFTNVLITGNSHLDKASEFVNMGNTVFNNVTIVDVNVSKSAVRATYGSLEINNSIIFGGVNGGYNAVHSLIDVEGIADIDVFNNPSEGDYTLKAGSPAINGGENALFTGLDENTRDLAGNTRVYDFNTNGIIDLGAYESSYRQASLSPTGGIIYVKEAGSGDESGSSWENATNRLQQAIDADGVNQVRVAVGRYNVIANSFNMKNGVAIYGGFDPEQGNDLDTRTLPSSNSSKSSILDGLNSRSVIENFGISVSPIDNTAILDGFTITGGNNNSEGGGGIYNKYASPTLRNLLIKENTARWDGGGVYNNLSSSPVMDNVIIANNEANYGGGMFNKEASSPVMHNVDIHKNKSANDGGGMYNDVSASPVLTNVAVTGNIAQDGGGIYNRNNSSPLLTNVTIAGNTSHALYAEGGTTSISNSILYGGITATYTARNSLIEGDAGGNDGNLNGENITLAQIFSNPAGGDYTLSDNSQAIDAGNGDWYVGLNEHSKDLVGKPRVFNYATEGIIDMGAYEYTAIILGTDNIVYVKVNATGTGTGDSWANATQSLQGAINAAGVAEVRVASGTYSVPENSFVMKNGVAVYGGFDPANGTRTLPPSAGGTILDGRNEVPVFQNNFTESNPLNHTALLDGFTITGGKSTGKGGGMSNIYASPTLNNLLIKGNSANADGGGMFNDAASAPAITNSAIKENTANYGAGIFNRNSSSALTNVEISGNKASSDGGGMYNDAASAAALSNVIIKENTANYGGGIFNRNSSPTLTNVKISGNTTSNDGGGMYNDNSSVVFQNVAMIGNTAANNGGGFYTNRSSLNSVLTNVTIIKNNANAGSAIYILEGAPQLNNAIVYGDIAGAGTYTFNYSLIEGNTSTDNKNLNATGITLTDIFTNESAGDYTLKKTSKAVDAGNMDLYTGLNVDTKDLEGNVRVHRYNTGGVIDLGAYESTYNAPIAAGAAGIVYVKPSATGSGDGSSWDDATDDLHNAIHTDGVQKVFVAVGEYKVGSNSFVMKNNVEIYGGFDPENGITDLSHNRILPAVTPGIVGGSVLNGEGARSVIRNQFTSATAMDNTAVLDGFTIQNGYIAGYGGGISNTYASPTLRNLVVKNNKGDWGAGLSTSYGSATVTNCIFTGNVAVASGGAILNSSDSGTLAVAVFTNCIIMGNTASTGGGISNSWVSATFINCAVTGNTSTSNIGIGGVYNYSSSSIVFINSTIANNGGHTNSYVTSGSSALQNSIVWDNINGSYNASHSLILNNNNTSNGNIDATGLVADDIFTNPLGGDYTLKENSLAIDAGEEGFYAGLDENTKDLTGNARVYGFNGGGRIDLGAYESSYITYPLVTLTPASGVIYVKETASGLKNGSSWANATNNLNRAIRISGVQKVFTAVGNYPASYIAMKNNVAVYGGFDPDNGISALTDARILPNPDTNIEGTVLNGQGTTAVIGNDNNGLDNTAILDGFTLTNGRSSSGGGIYNNGASPALSNLWIKGNTATADGGGMYNINSSSPVMANVTISNNTANYAGGIFNRNNSSPVMRNVNIKANTSTNDGGGMYNDVSASPVLTNVSITGNTAKNGAGMYNRGNSSPTLVNTLIANNTANANGGAIRNETSSSPLLTNVTIANNTGLNALYATDGSTSLANSIIYGGITGSYTAQYSLAQGNSSTANGNLDATGITLAQIFVDPTAGNYTLSNSSPATDAGDNTLIPLDVTTDLAGNARIQKGTVDLGAYERAYNPDPDDDGIIYVKTNATGNGSGNSWDNAMDNLQDAINTNNVLKVFVAKGIYNIPSTSSFTMKEGVKIYGGFDPDQNIKTLENNRILPDASNPDNDIQGTVLNGKNQRTVISNRDNGLTAAALLDGFTIMNGQGSDGGGIYNYYVSPTFSNLVIRNNTAVYGGGVYITSSNPVFTHVSIINNTATTNGGGMKISASAPEISNSLISGNTAPYGAGVFNSGANGTASAFTNVVITGNQATETTDQDNSGGGGIYNTIADLVLTNVIISNNSTKFQGGGFRNMGGNPVLTNVSLANNTAEANYEAIAIVEGTPKINNSIIYGTIGGAYTAQNSLIQGNTDFNKGNLDATDIILTDIFTNESTGDYTLSEYSPAIDKGDNTLYASLDGDTKDLAGNARVFKFTDGRKIDLGAYEYQGDLAPLPVTLIDFTAKAEGKRAMLQWQTAKETDNAKFIIYRSADGKEFVQIGELPGNLTSPLNSNYVFYDYSPLNGNNYYQLVQVDQNGKASELAIKNLNFGFQILDIRLYPNPTQDHFTVSFEAGRFSQLELVDLNGKVLQRETINSIENSKTLSIVIYPAGIYMVKLGGKGQMESRKVIKK